jgi:hypothetical protein
MNVREGFIADAIKFVTETKPTKFTNVFGEIGLVWNSKLFRAYMQGDDNTIHVISNKLKGYSHNIKPHWSRLRTIK